MSNASYQAMREGLMDDTISLSTGVLKVALVRGYTFSNTHRYLSDVIAAGAVINATSAAMTGKTFALGVFDADDTPITAVTSAVSHVLIIYQASGPTGGADVAATAQRLCFYYDTGSNLPIAPAGGTITIVWPATDPKIYKIGS